MKGTTTLTSRRDRRIRRLSSIEKLLDQARRDRRMSSPDDAARCIPDATAGYHWSDDGPVYAAQVLGSDASRAQRWHDTDHGPDRGRPLRSNQFRQALADVGGPPVSACWCCCSYCDPDDSDRPNPYWNRAAQSG